MKIRNFIINVFLLFAVSTLIIACNENEEALEESLTAVEITSILSVDDVTIIVDDIIDQDEADDPFTLRSSQSSIANCVTRTVEETDTQRIVTLDFGTGCTTNNGREFSGIIRIVYSQIANGISKEVSFNNFYFNSNNIAGSRLYQVTRQNFNGNPEASITVDLTITFSGGISVSRTGTKVREKIEGADTDTRGDDVYSVTGNWQTIISQGVVRTAEVTTPLIREFSCRYFVSGVIDFTRGEASVSLDFGNGECDNIAIASGPNGNSFEVNL